MTKFEIAIRIYEKYKPEGSNILKHRETEKIVEMTDTELIASIVDDSRGYASPLHAQRHVEAYEEGEEEVYCERSSAMFNNDLQKLIRSAADHWYRMNEEKQRRLIDAVERWRKVEEEDMASMSISMMYPTSSV